MKERSRKPRDDYTTNPVLHGISNCVHELVFWRRHPKVAVNLVKVASLEQPGECMGCVLGFKGQFIDIVENLERLLSALTRILCIHLV